MLKWKFFTCLLVILTILLITDTHDTLLKCKDTLFVQRRGSFITIYQLQLLT